MKRYAFISIIIVLIIGFLTGFYLFRINEFNSNDSQIAELIEDECTEFAENNKYIVTNNNENKTSPNCTITFKIYYKKCGHIIEKNEVIENKYVNLTEVEFKEKFTNWEVQRFTPTQITLYCELDEFCNEHYKIKEENGFIAIYRVNEKGEEEFIKKTDIATKYLAEEDLNKIKKGIVVQSKQELNKVLEDYE